MHEVLVNRLGGLSLPRKSVVRLTDRPDMTLDVYRGRKTTMQQQQQLKSSIKSREHIQKEEPCKTSEGHMLQMLIDFMSKQSLERLAKSKLGKTNGLDFTLPSLPNEHSVPRYIK